MLNKRKTKVGYTINLSTSLYLYFNQIQLYILPLGVLHAVSKTSTDWKRLVKDIKTTCRTGDDLEYLWDMKTAWLVNNSELETRYERKRELMRELVRSHFSYVKNVELIEILKDSGTNPYSKPKP